MTHTIVNRIDHPLCNDGSHCSECGKGYGERKRARDYRDNIARLERMSNLLLDTGFPMDSPDEILERIDTLTSGQDPSSIDQIDMLNRLAHIRETLMSVGHNMYAVIESLRGSEFQRAIDPMGIYPLASWSTSSL